MTGEPKKSAKTKFLIFAGSPDRGSWTFIGEELANDRDQALRLFDPGEGIFCAVSEFAWNPKRHAPKVVTSMEISNVEMTLPPVASPVRLAEES